MTGNELMNPLEHAIEHFFLRIEGTPLTKNATVLFYSLLRMWQVRQYRDEFVATYDDLNYLTTFPNQTICRAKKELIDKGYVFWHRPSMNSSGLWRIVA